MTVASSPEYSVTLFTLYLRNLEERSHLISIFEQLEQVSGTEICHVPLSREFFQEDLVIALGHAQNQGPGADADSSN